MKNFIGDFLLKELDNFLHRNSAVADALKKRIEQNERERKELAGIKKLANERAYCIIIFYLDYFTGKGFINCCNIIKQFYICLIKNYVYHLFILKYAVIIDQSA